MNEQEKEKKKVLSCTADERKGGRPQLKTNFQFLPSWLDEKYPLHTLWLPINEIKKNSAAQMGKGGRPPQVWHRLQISSWKDEKNPFSKKFIHSNSAFTVRKSFSAQMKGLRLPPRYSQTLNEWTLFNEKTTFWNNEKRLLQNFHSKVLCCTYNGERPSKLGINTDRLLMNGFLSEISSLCKRSNYLTKLLARQSGAHKITLHRDFHTHTYTQSTYTSGARKPWKTHDMI